MKSRQLGFTTDESIDMLDDTLFTQNYNCLMLSYDQDSALQIFDDKISLAWDNFPEDLAKLYGVDSDRANKLKFDFGKNSKGERVYSTIVVKTRGRSGTYNRVHVSEFGKICAESPSKAKEIISGTFNAVPIDGRIDIESTAEGETGKFYEMFWEAWDRGEPSIPTEFKAHFYNWTWDKEEIAKIVLPELNLPNEFREIQRKYNFTPLEITYYYYKWLSIGKDWDILHQEYPITPEEAFISSGRKLFNQEKVQLLQRYVKEPIKLNGWNIYETFKNGHFYAIGADTSEGMGRDANTAVIWDFTLRPRVVATFKNNRIDPGDFAYELRWAADRYGKCLVAVERNYTGMTTLSKLKEIYDVNRIYKETKTEKEEDEKTEILGWRTTSASKPKMMYDIAEAVNDELIDIPDKTFITELRTYERDDMRVIIHKDEEGTRHWDLLTAGAIGYQMRTEVDPNKNAVKTITNNKSQDDIHSAI